MRSHLVLLLIALALASCEKPPPPKARMAPKPEPDPVTGGPSHVECSGLVRGGRSWPVTLGAGEHVLRVAVQEGEMVEKGDLLVQLGNRGLVLSIMEIRQSLLSIETREGQVALLALQAEQEESNVSDWDRRIEEEKALGVRVPDYPTAAIVEDMNRERKKAESAVKLLRRRAEVLLAEAKRDRRLVPEWEKCIRLMIEAQAALTVTCPVRARVTSVHRMPDRATAGERIMELQEKLDVTVVAEVPQQKILRVRPGQAVRIIPDFYEAEPLVGEVEQLLMKKDDSTERYPLFPVRIRILTGDHRLVPGMRVSVQIELPPTEKPAK